MKRKILSVFGTRPEAIKMASVVKALEAHPNEFESLICVTGQHRQMLDQVLNFFKIKPDFNLDLMEEDQALTHLTARLLTSLEPIFSKVKPDWVLVQGDTTTTMVASLAAFYKKISVGHIEAGLRSNNKFAPFPEEINRVLVSHIADYHFAPTEISRDNLLSEGIDEKKIFVTGNTVIDSLFFILEKIENKSVNIVGIPKEILERVNSRPFVLITGHRRENFGEGFESICNAIVRLANIHPNADFIYPVHLNPNVRDVVFSMLRGIKNVFLIEPLDYVSFVYLLDKCKIVLTDSGGVQEEAPSLGKPVLVMRDTTERPEAVEMGTVKLVGTNITAIVENVTTLLSDEQAYNAMAQAVNPYGDGKACQRIVAAMRGLVCLP
jgi:UDP-N-acetylglucosamine 2-epimerase (non-hydrolysing)